MRGSGLAESWSNDMHMNITRCESRFAFAYENKERQWTQLFAHALETLSAPCPNLSGFFKAACRASVDVDFTIKRPIILWLLFALKELPFANCK